MSATQAAKRPFSDSFFSADLAGADPEIARAIELELGRQRQEIELMAQREGGDSAKHQAKHEEPEDDAIPAEQCGVHAGNVGESS